MECAYVEVVHTYFVVDVLWIHVTCYRNLRIVAGLGFSGWYIFWTYSSVLLADLMGTVLIDWR